MSINVRCTECEATMLDGVLKHAKTCSANNFLPQIGYGMRPPAQTITFDTPEEQKKFMDNLGKAQGSAPLKEND